MDFTNTCRACMQSDQTVYPLFFDNVSDIFMTCTELKILENDELPQKICSTCTHQLEALYQFKLQCQMSDASFISHLTENSNSSAKADVKSEPSSVVTDVKSVPPAFGGCNVHNFPSTCRACMRSDQTLHPLFFRNVSDIFMTCTEIEILENDELPQNICATCTRHLEASYEFKMQCQMSEASFISYMTDNSNSSSKPMLTTDVKSEPNCDIADVESDTNFDVIDVKPELNCDVTGVKLEPSFDVKSEPTCDVNGVELEPTYDENGMESEPNFDVTDVKSEPSCDITDVDSELSCDATDLKSEPDSESEHESNDMEYSNVTNENPVTLISSDDDDSSNNSSKPDKINKSKLKSDKPSLIECSKCKKQYTLLSSLKRHVTRGCNSIISCGLCDFECDTEIKLSPHLDGHMKDEDLSCKKCDYTGVDSADYLCHRYVHQTTDYGKRLFCWRCGNKFFNVERFEFHIRSQYLKKPPGLCKVCLKEFGCMRSFRAHKCTEGGGNKPYKCDMCETRCVTKQSLARHMNCHTKIKKIVCRTCKETFSSISELINHRFQMHDSQPLLPCNDCGKLFQSKITLQKHILRFASNKEYKCTLRAKMFGTTSDLSLHMKTDSGLEPYQCKHCNVCFKTRYRFVIHIRQHTGERPYECDICKKRLISFSSLKNHKLLHSKVRLQYSCQMCDKSYLKNSTLIRHMKTHEVVKEELQEELSHSN